MLWTYEANAPSCIPLIFSQIPSPRLEEIRFSISTTEIPLGDRFIPIDWDHLDRLLVGESGAQWKLKKAIIYATPADVEAEVKEGLKRSVQEGILHFAPWDF
jgi:hypothetical protein